MLSITDVNTATISERFSPRVQSRRPFGDSIPGMDLNYYVLLVFAPLLIVVGILGFVIPDDKSLTSGAPAYNVFHIVFGVIGVACLSLGSATSAANVSLSFDPLLLPSGFPRAFNVGFGSIDLYQAVASYANLPPKAQFRWKRADDVLHIVIGLALVIVGILF